MLKKGSELRCQCGNIAYIAMADVLYGQVIKAVDFIKGNYQKTGVGERTECCWCGFVFKVDEFGNPENWERPDGN